MADNNSIVVPIAIDAQKAEISLNHFQTTLQSFTTNYNQTINNIYQLSEKSQLSFSKLVATIANTGFAFSQIKAVISSVANFINGFVQLGDAMDKASLRTGISVESLGGLKFAAEQCGANFEILTDGLKTFQKRYKPPKLSKHRLLIRFRMTESYNNHKEDKGHGKTIAYNIPCIKFPKRFIREKSKKFSSGIVNNTPRCFSFDTPFVIR